MTWTFDTLLVTTSEKAKYEKDEVLWEAEDLGGMTEDNNRVPVPIVWLLLLTVLTAFAITFPLWGQRPTAALYSDYIKAVDDPDVKAAASDADAMAKIVAKSKGSADQPLLERHPLTMDDLRIIKPQIEELQKQGVDLKDYTVVGPSVVRANFEGNYRANGTREYQQPWWDKGYTIDVFYVIAFFIGVTLTIKRLPPSTWQPRHGGEHK
ncbi:MAG TPA: hypothetical protein VKG67_00115 [Gallionellaceae bacterium]|nr:hypothetical protein [Gallionellaceae bacterium]